MLQSKLSFQTRIIFLLIIAFVVMSAGIFIVTYTILYDSMLDRYYAQGDYIVESIARTIDTDRFGEMKESLNDAHPAFDSQRIHLFRIKSANNAENIYTATMGEDGSSLVYVVDGNERYGDEFTMPGVSLDDAGGRNREEAFEAYSKGRPTRTAPYRTEEGQHLLSIYYPVFDAQNKVLGIVGCDFDFKSVMHSVYKDLMLIMFTIGIFALLTIGAILLFFRINLIRPVYEIRAYLQKIASGDLSDEFSGALVRRADEIGTIVRELDHTRTSFRDIIRSIHDENTELQHVTRQAAEEITSLHAGVTDIDETTQQISAGMEQTAASSEEMDATAHQIVSTITVLADKAEKGTVTAAEISERADALKSKAVHSRTEGKNVTEEVHEKLKDAIGQSKSVNEINTLADSILNITEQTNLLALNAAIEAARAGESGKGFTVVADEIMKLANESQETANRIIDVTKVVLDSVSNLAESSQQVLTYIEEYMVKDYEVMVDTGKQYSADAQAIQQITSEFKETSEQLLSSVQDTIKAIDEISKSAQDGSAETAQIANNTTVLNTKADSVLELSTNVTRSLSVLNERLKVFKV